MVGRRCGLDEFGHMQSGVQRKLVMTIDQDIHHALSQISTMICWSERESKASVCVQRRVSAGQWPVVNCSQ
eukprot:m.193804 g.193804  ORF g.193804 m.193804 type:complete len:71 (-) comp24989_c0_seq10:104-316(-)